MSPPIKETISDYPVKPRRTQGTRSYAIRNRVAFVGLVIGSLFGFGYALLPSTNRIREYARTELYTTSDATKLKRNRLAPFNSEDEALRKTGPVIINPATAESARESMSFFDPKHIKPEQ